MRALEREREESTSSSLLLHGALRAVHLVRPASSVSQAAVGAQLTGASRGYRTLVPRRRSVPPVQPPSRSAHVHVSFVHAILRARRIGHYSGDRDRSLDPRFEIVISAENSRREYHRERKTEKESEGERGTGQEPARRESRRRESARSVVSEEPRESIASVSLSGSRDRSAVPCVRELSRPSSPPADRSAAR